MHAAENLTFGRYSKPNIYFHNPFTENLVYSITVLSMPFTTMGTMLSFQLKYFNTTRAVAWPRPLIHHVITQSVRLH